MKDYERLGLTINLRKRFYYCMIETVFQKGERNEAA